MELQRETLPHELAPYIVKWTSCADIISFAMTSWGFYRALNGLLCDRWKEICEHVRRKRCMHDQLLDDVNNTRCRLKNMYNDFQYRKSIYLGTLQPIICKSVCCKITSSDMHLVKVGTKYIRYNLNKYNNNILHAINTQDRSISMLNSTNGYYKIHIVNHPWALNLKLDKCYNKHYNTYYKDK
jgi:hypothetical protein